MVSLSTSFRWGLVGLVCSCLDATELLNEFKRKEEGETSDWEVETYRTWLRRQGGGWQPSSGWLGLCTPWHMVFGYKRLIPIM